MKSHGTLKFEDNALRIILSDDFIRYYRWLIEKYFFNTLSLQYPKHKAHITVINPKIHKNLDFSTLKQYDGLKVEFEYNPEDIRIGGQSKGFMNFWMPVKCEFLDKIKEELKIQDRNFFGHHITIANTKNL